VYSPHEFLLMCELDMGEGCMFFVEGEVHPVLSGAGKEGAVFGGLYVCGWCCMCVRWL
jgi:hypothetical protein